MTPRPRPPNQPQPQPPPHPPQPPRGASEPEAAASGVDLDAVISAGPPVPGTVAMPPDDLDPAELAECYAPAAPAVGVPSKGGSAPLTPGD